MNFGFVIDNRTCIGCHACSTACKAENEVPLGVHRTWVKSVEKGAFPDVRRFFQVTRCNHCANPPCTRICPVEAMYQRDDGIVDFDPRVCIGCKACLQACPYDAIHIDPNTGTAAKCHYCAHRVEVGLEPACVVVCPEHAIIAGDMDDPSSEISRTLARHTTSVRKPEQGTAPKLFYIDAEEVSLTPTASRMTGGFAFADVVTDQALAMRANAEGMSAAAGASHRHTSSGATVRAETEQGMGSWQGPIYVGQTRMAEQMVQTVHNAQHKVPWHWPVPAYLVTKAIAAGIPLLLAPLVAAGHMTARPGLYALGALVALAFAGLTALLLVMDLDRPERFLLILTRPQWSSWLTRGAFVLIGHSVLLGLWLAAASAEVAGARVPGGANVLLALLLGASAVATASYTAFLFGQAEGRDLWQSPLLPVHLVVQAIVAGSAMILLLLFLFSIIGGGTPPIWLERGTAFFLAYLAGRVLLAGLLADVFIVAAGELGMPHASATAARAARVMSHGRFRNMYRWGAIGVGHLVPIALLLPLLGRFGGDFTSDAWIAATLLAPLAALAGLYAYEHAFVMAPQEIPNS